MRLIDAIVYRKILEKEKESWDRCVGEVLGLEIAIADLGDMPTIDAVSVVRCKDCKHKRHLQGATDEANVCALGWGLSGIIAEEDFCSYGERRADHG